MSITIGIIITAVTLVLGQVVKLFNVKPKWIPLQNILITIIASIICIVFKVEDRAPLEIIVTCIFATMGAGGIYDLTKVIKKE